MRGIRSVLLRHRAWAMALLAVALMMRAFVPAGYMAKTGPQVLEIRICSDSASNTASSYHLTIPAKDTTPGKHGAEHVKATCAFSSLGHAALSSVDPVLLALAILFILTLGYQPQSAFPLASRANARPPVRGPPILT